MKCPTCKQALLTCEIAGTELDYCAQDHGYWFDRGELEAFLQSQVPVLCDHESGARSDRRCPRCRAPMNLHHPFEGLELDLCPHGDGIWFDEAELGTLIAKLKVQQASHELPHLDHVFAALATKLGGTP